MNRDEALELARSLLLPTNALGYLVTRGPAWPPLPECREYKRAVGHVMGNAYLLLKPIWEEHPDHDPGSKSNSDPLGFSGEPPAETNPAGLLPYLAEAHRVLGDVVSRMMADTSLARHKDFIEDSVRQLEEAILRAQKAFGTT